VREPASDGQLQTPDAVEAAAADGLAGDQGEPAFDQVEPRGTGRSEVQMEARVDSEPVRDRGMLVGPVIVADQMQLKSWIAFGQRFQEGDEFDVGMALEALFTSYPPLPPPIRLATQTNYIEVKFRRLSMSC
jgi:hypothetical protein